MKKKWTIEPGTRKNRTYATQEAKVEDELQGLITDYMADKEDKKIVCMADGDEIVYFLVFSREGEEVLENADILILNPITDDYEFLPKDIATQMANAYIEHVSTMAEAYRYLEEKGE